MPRTWGPSSREEGRSGTDEPGAEASERWQRGRCISPPVRNPQAPPSPSPSPGRCGPRWDTSPGMGLAGVRTYQGRPASVPGGPSTAAPGPGLCPLPLADIDLPSPKSCVSLASWPGAGHSVSSCVFLSEAGGGDGLGVCSGQERGILGLLPGNFPPKVRQSHGDPNPSLTTRPSARGLGTPSYSRSVLFPALAWPCPRPGQTRTSARPKKGGVGAGLMEHHRSP